MRTFRSILTVLVFAALCASFAPKGVEAQVGKLIIQNAIYGKNGQGKNVTRRLNNMINNNTLDVKVNNDNMGGDPNVGADKSLKVDYTYHGQNLHKVVKEGDRLKLP